MSDSCFFQQRQRVQQLEKDVMTPVDKFLCVELRHPLKSPDDLHEVPFAVIGLDNVKPILVIDKAIEQGHKRSIFPLVAATSTKERCQVGHGFQFFDRLVGTSSFWQLTFALDQIFNLTRL